MRTYIYLLLAAVTLQAQPVRLQQNIERITRSVNAQWGIYIKVLDTGEEIAINADKQMDTMSTIKIPLMLEAFRQIEAGKFSLTDKVTLTAAMKRPGTGILRSLDPGATITIKDTLTLMNIVSDNTATDILCDLVGFANIEARMRSLGLADIHTPTDCRGLFRRASVQVFCVSDPEWSCTVSEGPAGVAAARWAPQPETMARSWAFSSPLSSGRPGRRTGPTFVPSRPSAFWMTRAVRSTSWSRLHLSSGVSALFTGQFTKKPL